MKKRFVIVALVLLLAVGVYLAMTWGDFSIMNEDRQQAESSSSNAASSNPVAKTTGTTKTTNTTKTTPAAPKPAVKVITKEEIPGYLEKQNFIKELPGDALLALRLYNFDSGEREWDAEYVIRKGDVEMGSLEEVDAEILLHSKYLQGLAGGLCFTVDKASKNGDLGVELKIGKTAFMWKYRSMMDYKSCFGL